MPSFFVKTASIVGVLTLTLCAAFAAAPAETPDTTPAPAAAPTPATAPAPAPKDVKAILGVVTPAQTTIGEAAAVLKKKDCEYKEEYVPNQGRKITVLPGCFQLLGDPRVIFVGPEENKPVGNVWLEFDPGVDGVTYQCYVDALDKSYGEPTATGFDGGVRFALWNAPERKLLVVLAGSEATGPRLVNYYVGDMATELWNQFQKRHATSDEDMKNL